MERKAHRQGVSNMKQSTDIVNDATISPDLDKNIEGDGENNAIRMGIKI